MSFKSFLIKHSHELRLAASAMSTMQEGLALSPRQNAIVSVGLTALTAAADNIEATIDTVKETPKPSASDIAKGVADYIAKNPPQPSKEAIAQAVATEVAKAMTAYTKPTASV